MIPPACMHCTRFMVVVTTGIYVTEFTTEEVGGIKTWVPYRVWSGDHYRCSDCGNQIVTNYGREPVSIRHHANFKTALAYQPMLSVMA